MKVMIEMDREIMLTVDQILHIDRITGARAKVTITSTEITTAITILDQTPPGRSLDSIQVNKTAGQVPPIGRILKIHTRGTGSLIEIQLRVQSLTAPPPHPNIGMRDIEQTPPGMEKETELKELGANPPFP